MSTVYVLELPEGYYVGVTDNIAGRLRAHRRGECRSSKKLGAEKSCELFHSWEVPNRWLAENFEYWLHLYAVNRVKGKQRNLDLLFEIVRDAPFWRNNIFFNLVRDCTPPRNSLERVL